MEHDNEFTTNTVRMQRDALMTQLVAQVNGQVQRLALLAGSEKAAVAKLMAIVRAMTIYARSASPDPQVMSSFWLVLESFSPMLHELAILPDAASDTTSVIDFLKATLVGVTQLTEDGQAQTGVSRPLPLR